MTLIAVYDAGGCVGRCDERCYGAKHQGCDCVCEGSNHGRGERAALENTAVYAERWVRELGRRTGRRLQMVLGDAVEQMRLFQEGE